MKNSFILHIAGLIAAAVLLGGCGTADTQQASAPGKESAAGEDAAEKEDAGAVLNQEYLSEDPVDKLLEDPYEDYQEIGGEIAFILDGNLDDGSYNDAVYMGMERYALAAGISFSYYLVNKGESGDYQEVIEYAADNDAKIILCGGYDFEKAVGALQDVYPEISFLLIDGTPKDDRGNPVEIADNVHCVLFEEQESGYLAGYLAVLEGYRKLGFIGGEEIPSVVRYGYGYLQGINDAAGDLGLKDVEVSYWYSGTFKPEDGVYEKAAEWYGEGTEIIFACGGDLYKSVLKAADEQDRMLIGVDVDQSGLSERFLTSAMKDLKNAVVISLDDYYASGGRWSEEFAGQTVRYGVEDNCTGIPVLGTEWRFKQVTVKEFYELYQRVRKQEIIISDETDAQPQVSVITVNYQ